MSLRKAREYPVLYLAAQSRPGRTSAAGIRRFAQGYEIKTVFPERESFYRWLFAGKKEWEELPEKTSLQRAVKAYLASGGRIGEAFGQLKPNRERG